MSLNGGELVNYTSGQLTVGGNTCGANAFYNDYHSYYWPIYYPSYHICEKSKIEQAFKIIGKLMESKIIEKELTVKEFMKLVNDVAGLV